MKKVLVCMFMLLPFMSIMAQQVSHTVQRGETLESIAKKYNVSVYALTQSNPDAKDLFYVGMKLVIPNSKATRKEVKTPETETPIVASPTVPQKNKQEETQKKSGFIQRVEGMIDVTDVTIMLRPDDKFYGIRLSYNNGWVGMISGFYYQFVSHGTSNAFLGLGLAPKYATGPLLVGVSLYPYVNLYNKTQYKGDSKYGVPMFEDKTKVGYGGALDITAGLKVYTTKKGHDIYVTGSYHVDAFEFKTDGAFKNGLWGVGISTTI